MATDAEKQAFQGQLAEIFRQFYDEGYARGKADAETDARADAFTQELLDIMRPARTTP